MMTYTLEEVSKHDGKNGARTWIVINDLVYDVTDYMKKHPGGPELVEEYAGKDATAAFDDFGHSSDAKRMLKDLLIGEVDNDDKVANKKRATTKTTEQRKRRLFLIKMWGKCTT